MPKCPSCDAELDMDFGMVTCKACQAVLMIDISGKVQMASGDPSSFDDDSDSEIFENDESDPEGDTDDDLQDDNFEDSSFNEDPEDSNYIEDDQNWDDPVEDSGEDSADDDIDDNNSFSEPDEISDGGFNPDFAHFNESEDSDEDLEDESLDDSDLENGSGDIDLGDDEEVLSSPKAQHEYFAVDDEPKEEFPMAAEPDPNPVDISDFANSEESNLEEGELLYDIYLSRIDSKDQKDEVKFVLMDEKLKLNHGEFLKNIKGGKLVIPDLNPIKAKRIVEQLQYSDLDIKWKQKRVIIETVEPDDVLDQEGDVVDDGEVDL